MFKLQDNLSNEKVTFESKEITAYVCGPTVYDHPHIGNLRPIITYDIMFRILNYQGIKVNFLHNITDIDDKIIEKAINENKSESEITNFYTDEYLKLLDTLNVVSISKVVKVSDSITGIQSFVSEMIEKDIAYEIDGNVFFDLEKSKDYGKLSNRTLSEKDFENEFTNLKRNPKDFVL
ncbi:MAG: hypothetical protein DRP42_00305 [Tenericutes bacterium]|nr:MAG: hypothetical protein DRP42_00305 [Mycoplasmatota bacterium]